MRSWRDPRLAAGIVVIAVSILAGAGLLSDRETVRVWSARGALPAGADVAQADLDLVSARLPAAAVGRYLAADTRPTGTLARPVGAGELLPRAALDTGDPEPTVLVPVAANAADVPPGVAAGSTVDVWVLPDGADRAERRAAPVFLGAEVVSLAGAGDALSPTPARTLVVRLARERELGPALTALSHGRVLVVARSDP